MGNKLRQARLQRGLTREELERKAGVPMGSVFLLESGGSEITTANVLVKLSAALDRTVEEIFLD